jgi:hypothetical protein
MSYKNIELILNKVYGVDAISAPPEAVLWASDKLPADLALEEIRALNREREKLGKMLIYIPYGHRLFFF